MNGAPSPRQRDVLEFMVAFRDEKGISPTLREIGNALGMTSTNGVAEHLVALERKGYVDRRPMMSRGTTLTPKGNREAGVPERLYGFVMREKNFGGKVPVIRVWVCGEFGESYYDRASRVGLDHALSMIDKVLGMRVGTLSWVADPRRHPATRELCNDMEQLGATVVGWGERTHEAVRP